MILPQGPSNARMMIVLDCVSYRDLQQNTILNDREFDKMLEEAGASRSSCFVTALIKEATRGQDFDLLVAQSKKEITPSHKPLHDRMVQPLVLSSLKTLEKEIDLIKPQIILALGNGPLFTLTGKWGIKSWRSSLLDYTSPSGHKCLVVPTWPPSYIYAVWKDRNTCIHDIRKAWSHANSPALPNPPAYDFIIEPSFPQVTSTLNKLLAKAAAGPLTLSVDIETRGGHIACIGIAWSKTEAICIPLLRAAIDPQKYSYWRDVEEAFIVHLLYRLLTHENVEVIGQNFIYDAQYFYRWLLFIPRFKRDTMIAQHCMFNIMPKGLDFLSSMYTAYHVYWKDESKNWNPKLGERQLWIYNCKDACVTYEVDETQQNAIAAFTASGWEKLKEVHDFQQSLFWPVLETMNRGIRVNHASRASLSEDLGAALKAREDFLTEVIGHPINIRSPLQMSDFFYRELNQKPNRNRNGGLTCDDAALEKIGSREPLLLPILKTISEMRSLGVFKSTFIEAPTDLDDRMRCSFNIAGTKSYRFSSSQNAFDSGMNLQNIPSGDESAEASSAPLPNVRKLFLSDPDHIFFDIDLDSADLRIVVEESNCIAMRQMLAEGKKPYVEVAKEYYKDPSITKSHPAYKFFKAFCHATHYLGTPSGMADAINANARAVGLPSFTIGELEKLQNWYFSFAPEIKAWHERITEQVYSRKYVENAFGYRFWFFDRIDKNVLNEAISLIPQSTVANVINRGYKNLHDNHPEIQVLLQVHDSLGGQFHKSVSNGIEIVEKACSIVVPYPNPLVIPVGLKTSDISWGHCD